MYPAMFIFNVQFLILSEIIDLHPYIDDIWNARAGFDIF